MEDPQAINAQQPERIAVGDFRGDCGIQTDDDQDVQCRQNAVENQWGHAAFALIPQDVQDRQYQEENSCEDQDKEHQRDGGCRGRGGAVSVFAAGIVPGHDTHYLCGAEQSGHGLNRGQLSIGDAAQKSEGTFSRGTEVAQLGGSDVGEAADQILNIQIFDAVNGVLQ